MSIQDIEGMNLFKSVNKIKLKYHGAFSLLELTVSMAIVGIVMAMLSNVLINAVIVSQKSIARSFIREEIASITASVSDDVRNADEILECEGEASEAKCVLVTAEGTISWEACDPSGTGEMRICKIDQDTGEILYSSSPKLILDNLSFEEGFTQDDSTARKNVLFSLVGSHEIEGVDVTNVSQQTSLSTRNYVLTISDQIDSGASCKTQTTTKEYVLEFVRDNVGCTWPGSRVSGHVSGYYVQELPVSIPDKILSINDIRVTGNRVSYDDQMVLTLGDIVLVSSVAGLYSPLPTQADGFKVLSKYSQIAGQLMAGSGTGMCIGDIPISNKSGSSCKLVKSESSGTVFIDIEGEAKDLFVNLINAENEISAERWLLGDNDANTDCRARPMDLAISAEIEYGCSCGNGIVEYGEQCDDGNSTPGDGCRADCTEEVCGDGITDPQEHCDYKDTSTTLASGYTCANNCSLRVNRGVSEDCTIITCPEDAPYLIGCKAKVRKSREWDGWTYEIKNRLEADGGDGRACFGVGYQGDPRKYFVIEGNICRAGDLDGWGICSSIPDSRGNGVSCAIESEKDQYREVNCLNAESKAQCINICY